MPNLVGDIVRHPLRDAYASGKAEFRPITIRDDGGETIGKVVSVARFKKSAWTDNGTALAAGEFSIDLPEGLFETRLRIDGAATADWVRFVNPPGGGRYLTLLQSFTGVPEDPSALEALYAVLAETYASIDDPRFEGGGGGFSDTVLTYDEAGNVETVTEGGVTTTYTYNPDGTVDTDQRGSVTRQYTYDGDGNLTGIEII